MALVVGVNLSPSADPAAATATDSRLERVSLAQDPDAEGDAPESDADTGYTMMLLASFGPVTVWAVGGLALIARSRRRAARDALGDR
jgi:hypothetical protein